MPFALAFGLIVGSYLNVVVYRWPRGMSTVRPASRCPRCVMPIRALDNVPVLGYVWLLARCRDCGLPISPRYPLVEATTGAWFALVHLRADSVLEHVAASLLGAFLLALALIDFDHHQVPILPTVVVTLLGLFSQGWLGWARWSGVSGSDMPWPSPTLLALFTCLLAGIGAYLLSALGHKLGLEEGLASGDIYVLAMLGALFGPRGLLVAFLLGGALALLIYAPRLTFGRPFFQYRIPFVTFLSIGAAAVLLMGPLAGQT